MGGMTVSRKCATCYRQTTRPPYCTVCERHSSFRRAPLFWLIVAVALAGVLLWNWRPATVTVMQSKPCPPGTHQVRAEDPGGLDPNAGLGGVSPLTRVCAVDR